MADRNTTLRFMVQGQKDLDRAADAAKRIAQEAKLTQSEATKLSESLRRVVASGGNLEQALKRLADSEKLVGIEASKSARGLLETEVAARRQAEAFNRAAGATSKAVARQRADLEQFAANVRASITNPLAAAGAAAEQFVLRFGKAGVVAAAAAAGIAIAAKVLTDLIKGAGQAGEELLNLSERTGLSVREASLFSAAARIAGVDIQATVGAVGRLSASLSENSEEGVKGRKALKDIGVEAIGFGGAIKPVGQLLVEIAKGLEGIQQPTERIRILRDIFGKTASEILPLFRNNLSGVIAELDRMGIAVDEKTARAADQFGDQIQKMEERIRRFTLAIKFSVAETLDAFGLLGEPTAAQQTHQRKRPLILGPGPRGIGPPGPLPKEQLLGAIFAEGQRALTKERQSALLARLDPALALEEQIKKATEDRTKAIADQDVVAAKVAQRRIKEAEKELALLQAILEFSKERGKRLGEDFEKLSAAAAIRGATPLLLERVAAQLARPTTPSLTGLGPGQPFVLPQPEIDTSALERWYEVLSQKGEIRFAQDKENLERLTSLEIRRIQALIGPGGELAAINRIAEERIRLAKTVFDLEMKNAKSIVDLDERGLKHLAAKGKMEAELDAARKNRQIEILELQQKQLQEFRDAAGRVFDALLSRGRFGLADLLTGFARTTLRQIFVNLASEIFKQAAATLKIPGIRDPVTGKLKGLGGIVFGGTGLDPGPQIAVQANTDAIKVNTPAEERNTEALNRLTQILSQTRGGFGGGFGIPGLPGTVGGGGTGPVLQGFPGTGTAGQGMTRQQQIGRTAIGAAATVSAFSQGGPRGVVQGAGAAAMTIAPFTGPAAPFVMAAGLAASLVGSFLPTAAQRRAAREQEIDQELRRRLFVEPTSITQSIDLYGRPVDRGKRGELRASQITININALDARSVLDRSSDIADAVRKEMQLDHPVRGEIRQAMG